MSRTQDLVKKKIFFNPPFMCDDSQATKTERSNWVFNPTLNYTFASQGLRLQTMPDTDLARFKASVETKTLKEAPLLTPRDVMDVYVHVQS